MRFSPSLFSLALVSVLAFTPSARADEQANWERLRSMPRDQRAALLDELKRFDALKPEEQKAIRALDEKMASLPAEDQVRYRSVLRRYHLWLQNLTDAQRSQLSTASPDARLKLVSEFRKKQSEAGSQEFSQTILQLADFGVLPPIETAHQIRIWQKCSPEERKKLEKLTNTAELKTQLNDLGKTYGLRRAEPLLSKMDDDALYTRLEAYLQSKGVASFLVPKGAEKTYKKREGVKDLRKRALVENYYFILNPPAPVSAENLWRFDASLPSWIRSSFDHLPSIETRRRLTILYRLLYPPGEEMPAAKSAATKKAEAPKANPAPANPVPPARPATPL